MGNLLFPLIPGPSNYIAWLVIVTAMFIWLIYLYASYGPTVVPITSQQQMGDKLRPIDVANQKRSERGFEAINEQRFRQLQEEALMQLRSSEPVVGKMVRRLVERFRRTETETKTVTETSTQ